MFFVIKLSKNIVNKYGSCNLSVYKIEKRDVRDRWIWCEESVEGWSVLKKLILIIIKVEKWVNVVLR